MGLGHSPTIVLRGLVLYCDAANVKSYPGSGTSWLDLSGYSNNGTLTDGPTFSSSNLGSIVFDGINDFVSCGNSSSLDVGNNITVNVWFYVNSVSSYQPIVAKVLNDFSLGWEFANSLGNLRLTFRPSATQINLQRGSLSVGNWYMGTMTYDNTTAILYLNGAQTLSTTSGGPVILNSTEPLTIGKRASGQFFNGNIANVQVYNRALSPEEIQQNFEALRGRYGI